MVGKRHNIFEVNDRSDPKGECERGGDGIGRMGFCWSMVHSKVVLGIIVVDGLVWSRLG